MAVAPVSQYSQKKYNFADESLKIRDFQVELPFTGKTEITPANKIVNVEIDTIDAHYVTDTLNSQSNYLEWKGIGTKELLNQIKYINASNAVCNSEAFCRIAEGYAGIEVPHYAQKMRIIFNEFERISNHFSVLANISQTIHIDVLHGELLWQKEKILKMNKDIFDSRVFAEINIIGGISERMHNMMRFVSATAHNILEYYKGIKSVFYENKAIISVLKDIGVLTEATARILDISGPAAKASNICSDKRLDIYRQYLQEFNPISLNGGDCYARTLIRVREISQSLSIICEIIDSIGTPEENTVRQNKSKASSMTRTGECAYEQSEGKVTMTVKFDENMSVKSFEVMTPKRELLRAMKSALIGNDFNDMPVIMATFNHCDFGTDLSSDHWPEPELRSLA